MKLKKSHLCFLLAAASSASSLYAAPAIKSGTAGTTELSGTPASTWTIAGDVNAVPGTADTATWDGTSLAGAQTITSNVSWKDMSFSSPSANIALSGTGSITLAPGNSVTSLNVTGSRSITLNNAIIISNAGAALPLPTTAGLSSVNRVASSTGTTSPLNLAGTLTMNESSPGANNANFMIRGAGTTIVSGSLNIQGQLYKGDGGTVILQNANTLGWVGSNNGTLLAGHDSSFGNGIIYFAAGGATTTLGSMNGSARTLGNALVFHAAAANFGQTSGGVGALTFSGTADLGTTTKTLTTNVETTFSGVMSGVGGGIIKAGSATLTLSGNNTYTGATTLNGGRLNLTGSLTSAITAGTANATLSGTGSTSGLLTMGAGSRIAIAGGAATASLTSNGATFSGLTDVLFDAPLMQGTSYDILTYGPGALTGFANLNGAAYRGGFTDTGSKITFTANLATRTWNTTTGTWGLGTDTNFAEGDQKFFSGDSVLFGNLVADATVTIPSVLAPTSIVVSNEANTLTFSGTGSIAGAASLVKSGNGNLTISTANSHTGKTTLTGGTLSIATITGLGVAPATAVADQLSINGATLSITGAGQTSPSNRGITIGAAGATFDVSTLPTTSTTDLGGIIAGSGPLTLKSSGDMSATGGGTTGVGIKLSNAANSFTGDVTITSGIVAYSNNSAFGNAANKIILKGGGLVDNNSNVALSRDIEIQTGGGTFRAYGSSNVTWTGKISGASNINRTDGGTLILTGDLSGFSGAFNNQGGNTVMNTASGVTGPVTVTAGEVHLTSTADALSAASSVALPGGKLRFNNATATNYSLNNLTTGRDVFINNGSTLTIKSGVLDIGTTNFWIQSSGTLGKLTSGAPSGDLAITVNTSAATDQRIKVAIVDNGTSAVKVVKNGDGKMFLDGPNTYTGSTTVNGGTLVLTTATLADAANVNLATGAILNLTHLETDTVGGLYIDGIPQAGGLYKSATGVGEGTVLAALTGTGKLLVKPNPFTVWMSGYDFTGFGGADLSAKGDPDHDGLANLVELVFGTAPNAANSGITEVGATATAVTFQHPLNPAMQAGVTYSYQWSSDLSEWKASGESNAGGTTVTLVAGAPVSNVVTVTGTISTGPATKLFVRIFAAAQ